MKMKMEMENRSHRYDINSLKYGHEYSTYKVSLYEYAYMY